MVKEIKIIDSDTGVEIKPEKDNLIVIPVNNKNEFVSVDTAKELINIIQGQINIIEVQVNERKTGGNKNTVHTDCKKDCKN